jgi:mRNA-degrading endonuclease RelE of RelBE toxin-antitoxin system
MGFTGVVLGVSGLGYAHHEYAKQLKGFQEQQAEQLKDFQEQLTKQIRDSEERLERKLELLLKVVTAARSGG